MKDKKRIKLLEQRVKFLEKEMERVWIEFDRAKVWSREMTTKCNNIAWDLKCQHQWNLQVEEFTKMPGSLHTMLQGLDIGEDVKNDANS